MNTVATMVRTPFVSFAGMLPSKVERTKGRAPPCSDTFKQAGGLVFSDNSSAVELEAQLVGDALGGCCGCRSRLCQRI